MGRGERNLAGDLGLNIMEDERVNDPDVRIMLRFKDGDTGAFEQIFHKYKKSIVNYLMRMVGNAQRAEELAQEVFLKVAEGRKSYRPESKLSTWIFRIATNHALNELRRREYRSLHEPLEPEKEDEKARGGEDAAGGRELEERLTAAMMGLPESQRAALLLCIHQGLSYREISLSLKISEKAVKSLIHRARESLKVALKDYL